MAAEQRIETCEECGAVFSCGGNCWCSNYPAIFPMEEAKSCLCKVCFHEFMVQKIREASNYPDAGMRKKIQDLGIPKKLIESIDYTINRNGLYEFSSWYLLRRGYCCKNGCKNCPYE